MIQKDNPFKLPERAQALIRRKTQLDVREVHRQRNYSHQFFRSDNPSSLAPDLRFHPSLSMSKKFSERLDGRIQSPLR